MTTSTVSNASIFTSANVNATATGAKNLYQRTGYNLVNASLQNALDLGTLTTDQTQLSTTATLSRGNSSHYYKFDLNGDNLKMDLTNTYGTDQIRIQLYNSNGKLVADSASTDQTLLDNFNKLQSMKGLKTKAGEYTARVTYTPTAVRSMNETYILSLYSGTRFSTSYATKAVSQTSLDQKVIVDNTLTYATTDAKDYSTQSVHYVGATIDDAVTIGWLYENKSALKVTSQLTNVSDSHYYKMTLQKGDALKMAFANKTDTTGMRVRLTDTTGYIVYADSEGTAAQQAAYKQLVSSDGLAAKKGDYVVDVTYSKTANKTKSQTYDFYMYSGDHYSSLYETLATTETVNTAILSGHLASATTNTRAATASYLSSQMLSSTDTTGLLSVLQMFKNY